MARASSGGEPDVLLIATGSEVQLALAARDILAREGIGARVVSMPCVEWFAEQDASYQTGRAAAGRARPGMRGGGCVAGLACHRR